MGYLEFANYISRIIAKFDHIEDEKQREYRKKELIKKEFNDRLILIDEVHNIRSTGTKKHKRTAEFMLKLVQYTDTMRLLLLSATPMYNTSKEIIWLINLMNINDNRDPVKTEHIFDKDGNFRVNKQGDNIGAERLGRKVRGYISFLRGENPYTFPFRIFPTIYAPNNSLLAGNSGNNKLLEDYPQYTLNNMEFSPALRMPNSGALTGLYGVELSDVGVVHTLGPVHRLNRMRRLFARRTHLLNPVLHLEGSSYFPRN